VAAGIGDDPAMASSTAAGAAPRPHPSFRERMGALRNLPPFLR
jgi:hypothetical protein